MEIRECAADDVLGLLHAAKDDKDIDFLNGWPQYQRWLLDAVYSKSYQVLVADDGFGIVGFLVWQLYQEYGKWVGFLHYVFVLPDFRKKDVGNALIWQYIHNIYNSSAQVAKFSSKVLSQEWIDMITANVPSDKYTTYYIPRTDELKEWYNSLKR